MKFAAKLINWFKSKSLLTKIIIIAVVLAIAGLLWFKLHGGATAKPVYQTETAQTGTLVTSISASGTVTAGAASTITTNASGVVQQVYVKNGDQVKSGQKIATLALDQLSQQRLASAWSNYTQAKNQLAAAQSKTNSLQAAEFSANQKFMNDAVSRNLATTDPTYIQENALWLQSQSDFVNQTGVISAAQSSLTSAWISYQQVSPDILAPITGTVGNLILAPGVTIAAQTANASGAISSQNVGTVLQPAGLIQATVNLSEIDVVKATPGQKVTLTLDAFPGKTFTGKLLIINTNGTVSSGVTTYPTTIAFDTSAPNIYPNMAVNANIITSVKDNVVLVSSAAVQSSTNGTTVRVLKNGVLTSVPVQVGGNNDTQTEIVSGISDGDTVVDSITNPVTSSAASTGTSVFSGLNNTRGGAAGGAGAATRAIRGG